MDGVGPMELRGGNIDITVTLPREFSLVPFDDGLVVSRTLDKTLVPNMVGG